MIELPSYQRLSGRPLANSVPKNESRAESWPLWAGSAKAVIAVGLAERQNTAPTAPIRDTTVRRGVYIPDFVPSQPTTVGAGGVEAVRTAAR